MNGKRGKYNPSQKTSEALEAISQDRTRTNLLKVHEQRLLAFLVQRIPNWMTPDMLTFIGLGGNMIVLASFVLATYVNRTYLLMGALGFAISWFGDSLDGRIAYYRNKPKKLYGFTLDITVDWIGIILIGCGYIIYAQGVWEFLGYGFVVMYGWEMIVALMRHRITGNYSIDSGKLGPTEARIIIIALMVAELLFKGSIRFFALAIVILVFICNIIDTRQLLQIAEEKDMQEAAWKKDREGKD